MRPILIPIDPPCDFPNLRIPSADHVCKSVEAEIEGEMGRFFGVVCRSTGLPDGYGAFEAGEWLHCGEVKHGIFQEGRKVSVNK